MKKLNKRFEVESDNLQAFITCSCPYIQCGCEDIYNPNTTYRATQDGLKSSQAHYQAYFGDI